MIASRFARASRTSRSSANCRCAEDRPAAGRGCETRHIDWASPLAGGPVTACFTLRTFLLLRDAVELAQRIDLDTT